MRETVDNECVSSFCKKQKHGTISKGDNGIKRSFFKNGNSKNMFICLGVLCNQEGETDMPKK